jgi:hypothetical protein
MTDGSVDFEPCIEIQERAWSRIVRTRLSVREYEGRRLERVFGYRRLLHTTPPVEALTTSPGPGFHRARIIDTARYEAQMLRKLGLK